LVDECIGKMTVRALAALVKYHKQPVEVKALLDLIDGQQGIKDPEWVPRAKAEGWYVITSDTGQSNDGAPLHILLPLYGVSAAYMTPTLQSKRDGFEKIGAIVTLWPRIIRAATTSEPGTRHRIRASGDTYTMVDWPLGATGRRALEREKQDFDAHLFIGVPNEPKG
jgi:hypothetical protein